MDILILDNLSNCSIHTLEKIQGIVQDQFSNFDSKKLIRFVNMDVLDLGGLDSLFKESKSQESPIEYIIHFAGKKAVGEAVSQPIWYFENNFIGSMNLIKMMVKYDCKNFIFSSTATCYGNSGDCKEEDYINPLHAYAQTKLSVEFLMKSQSIASPEFCFITLRYFNPAGAHKSGLLGDSPSVYPNNLFPFIEQVAIGKRPQLNVFGNDYNTHDGTGVRDYIHILDLADGHVAAFKRFGQSKGYNLYNLGTGKGSSVLDIVKAYSKVLGKQIPYQITDRRPGDVDILCARVDKANRELGWKHTRDLEEMCEDSLNFIRKNPDGIL